MPCHAMPILRASQSLTVGLLWGPVAVVVVVAKKQWIHGLANTPVQALTGTAALVLCPLSLSLFKQWSKQFLTGSGRGGRCLYGSARFHGKHHHGFAQSTYPGDTSAAAACA